MVRVALTGGIASGKSMVAAELAARGAIVIDADVLAYFQDQGPGYQTRINRVLRTSMLRALRRRK